MQSRRKDNREMQKTFTKECTNIVKGFAIILLLMYHLFHEEFVLTEYAVNYAPISKDLFLMISGFGNICVSIFVFLTSYGIAKSIFSNTALSIKEAYKQALKRFGKLMLQFFILYVSVMLAFGWAFDLNTYYGGGKTGFLAILVDSLGLHMFFETKTLNMTWWYMEIAYILIFLVPALAFLSKKIGYALLPIMFFLPFIIDFNQDIKRYIVVIAVGICAAYGSLPDKVMNWKMHWSLKWILGLLGMVLVVLIRQNPLIQEKYLFCVDAVVSLFVVFFVIVTIGCIPGVRNVFAFIGKHSMNIFLVHTFFYLIIFREQIYYFKYAVLILLVLLLVSLLYSVVLEGLKMLGRKGMGLMTKKFGTAKKDENHSEK